MMSLTQGVTVAVIDAGSVAVGLTVHTTVLVWTVRKGNLLITVLYMTGAVTTSPGWSLSVPSAGAAKTCRSS
jgi:hypothetical protein